MSIDTTIRKLCVLAETGKEMMAEKMEPPMIVIDGEDIEAIQNAVVALQGVRILHGIFEEKEPG
jgi:hypothetical protein